MDVNIIFAIATSVLIVGDIKVTATAPPGTAIPTLFSLFPPATTTLAPTFQPIVTKSTATSVKSTTQAATTQSSTTLPPPIMCNNGACDAMVCGNSSYKLPTRTCGPSINSCVTEVSVQNAGIKHYVFRCSTNTCTKEKRTATKGTEILCCNQSKCNTYEVALGTGTTWGSVNLILMWGLVTVLMF